MADVLVLFGSKSDEAAYKQILRILDNKKVSYDFKIASVHKTPKEIDIIFRKEYKVIIAGAGLAAALPGVAASRTIKPVIGVPVSAKLNGMDALLSIAQMPKGVPVAAVGIDNAENAAHLAKRILDLKG